MPSLLVHSEFYPRAPCPSVLGVTWYAFAGTNEPAPECPAPRAFQEFTVAGGTEMKTLKKILIGLLVIVILLVVIGLRDDLKRLREVL